MDNRQIADVLEQIADILEIQEANTFRVRAYRMAAQTIRGLGEPLSRIRQRIPLEQLPHIGTGISEKIQEMLDTGHCQELEGLQRSPEAGLVQITRLPGLGPKRARALYEVLGVDSIGALEQAAIENRVARVPGFGKHSQDNILQSVRRYRKVAGRHLLDHASDLARRLVTTLADAPYVQQAIVAGSVRRREETIGDLDLLATSRDHARTIDLLAKHELVVGVLLRGDTKARFRLRGGMECDLRVVDDASFGAASHYFTGNKAHNIRIRKRGQQRGLKINEYGVFRESDESEATPRRIGGRTEQEVFAAVDLPWIPPEIRLDRGEIEAAEKGQLPDLVTEEELRGDLHMHTAASDGDADLEMMIQAARARGYAYVAITDHSRGLGVVTGLDEKGLARQWQRIQRLNQSIGDLRILRGVEVEILPDGRLALEDSCLADADLVVAAVHRELGQSRNRMTRRVLKALDNPHLHVLAHPTGRLLLKRPPCDLDVERMLQHARDVGAMVECNAAPRRLDLGDVNLRLARDIGTRVVISSDAHRPAALDQIRFGVDTARRGWLGPEEVANTRDLDDFLALRRSP